ncbi:DUF1640 domain-containing protein [Martelella alba]|uniref:DUF1640 domain-containing protein n=1 Tax=Martelella alba TaxID=2590451 RepID=A0A506TX62_9HYPH|nr:DUF1640 domain-containing protein [Martelella alba]TPW26653.1 DUF1640 domain-containing protein [Martelella alba]
MAVLAFDTLKAANRLKEAGFDDKQAQELVSTFAEGVGENIATKHDIEKLESKIEALGQKMTIKLGSLMVAGVAFLALLDRLFPPA